MGVDAIILKRKILTAILSSLLFTLIISVAYGFEGFLTLYYIDFMLVVTYGVITSLISDLVCKKIFKSTRTSEIVSFLAHCFFGALFREFGLITAILFFVIDRLLKRVKINGWTVTIAFFIVALVFIMNII